MAPEYGYLFLFVFLGAGVKIIDDICDLGVLQGRGAYILAPILVLTWIYLSLGDKGYATILGAILLSSLLAGKVDNRVFKISAAVIIAAWLTWGIKILIVPLIVLTFLGILDEILDDYGEKKNTAGPKYLLKHRIWMKTGVIMLYAFAHLELLHVLAMLAFDFAYEIAPSSLSRGLYLIKGAADEYEQKSRVLRP